MRKSLWEGPHGQWLLGAHRPVSPQSLLAMSPEKRKLAAQEGRSAESPLEDQAIEKLHTLEEFSYDFFRCPLHPLETYHETQPPSASLHSLMAVGRPWRQVMCPPGLSRQKGHPLTLPRPPWGLGAVTCVPAECCGSREHRHGDPH